METTRELLLAFLKRMDADLPTPARLGDKTFVYPIGWELEGDSILLSGNPTLIVEFNPDGSFRNAWYGY